MAAEDTASVTVRLNAGNRSSPRSCITDGVVIRVLTFKHVFSAFLTI